MLAVLDHGPVARSTIARIAGLSPAAVSRQCADLIRHGLLREMSLAEKPVGRPHVPVDIDVGGPVVCGVHIALTYATLGLVNLRGQVVARERIPLGHDTLPWLVLERIASRIPAFTAAAGRRVAGIGVATGGWVDSGQGVIVDHPLLPGWHDVPVGEILRARTGLPVFVDGHSRALARAEQLFGDRRARSSVVHLFAGNVVDAAFAVGDVVQHGPRSAAGRVAHLQVPGRTDPCACGRTGCLQAVASEPALAVKAASAGLEASSFEALLDAALGGDPRAGRLFRQRARAIGAAAAVLLDLLNPRVLIVVEAGVMLLPGCLEVLRAEVRRRSLAGGPDGPAVEATSFGRDVLHVAASAVALSPVFADPLRGASSGW